MRGFPLPPSFALRRTGRCKGETRLLRWFDFAHHRYARNDNSGLPAVLQQHGLAEVAGIGGNSSADFTHKPGVSNESFVLFRIADLEAEIVQIAQVLVVARMRHFYLIHRISP
jgi:hypothetical protein